MNISVEPILIEQKSVFMQMMELYMYDFSEFSDEDINEYGYFGYLRIDDYWNEEGRYPFFIRVDGKLAGLVLVRSCCEYNDLPNPHNIAEFFVMKKYRRKGVGKEVAMKIFEMFPGGWEVSQWVNNLPAQYFWKQVISKYTKGKYDTFIAPGNRSVGFTFCNSSNVYHTNMVLEQLTHENYHHACKINRDDVPEEWVDTAATIMDINDYGLENHLIGHTFLARIDDKYIGLIMVGEALPWDTDPIEMKGSPFYRLMGFVVDKEYRNKGLGGVIMEKAIEQVYQEFGKRSLALGVHKDNTQARRFYERHGFRKMGVFEGDDEYYLRLI